MAVAVLLVRSVEYPTSPGCLQPLMFMFVEVEEGLLRWQLSREDWRRLPVSRLSVVHRCTPTVLARFLLCCGSPGPMWMIGRGPEAMGRWRLPVGQQLR